MSNLKLKQLITLVLATISITGMIGIPMGDPKFFTQAIGLELTFIALTILSLQKIRYILIPNIVIGIIIIIGNTISPQHIDIMFSLTPAENATVLFLGGYVFQIILIISSFVLLKKKNQ
ncbi:MAG: hypothetical protein KC483_08180 [Nitrosarchaeum sp.]|nr:hypothetical protein [Nitrosarchaeum sp.]